MYVPVKFNCCVSFFRQLIHKKTEVQISFDKSSKKLS